MLKIGVRNTIYLLITVVLLLKRNPNYFLTFIIMSNKCNFYGLTGTPDVQVDKLKCTS